MSNNTTPVGASITRDALQRLRKDPGGGVPQAYLDAGGRAVGVQGDLDGPWLKLPPFPQQKMELRPPNPLLPLQSRAASVLFVVDVTEWRTLQFEFDYTPATVTGQLNIMPLGGHFDAPVVVNTNFVATVSTLMVVDNTLTYKVVGTGADTVISSTFSGVRTIAPMSFETQVGLLSRILGTLSFDVSSFEVFAIGVADTGDPGNPGTLTAARYNLSM